MCFFHSSRFALFIHVLCDIEKKRNKIIPHVIIINMFKITYFTYKNTFLFKMKKKNFFDERKKCNYVYQENIEKIKLNHLSRHKGSI